MHKLLIGITIGSLMLAGAQKGDRADLQLQAAINKEVVEGDLKSAIEQYRKLSQSPNRAVAAKALLRMGQCYERLGDSEARKAYERVTRDFADQRDPAAEARTRLAALNGPRRPAAVTMRRLSAGQEPDNEGRPSPDGQWLTYTTPDGGLAIYNLLTAEKRVLKPNPHDFSDHHGWVEESTWSPDGKQIAYGWEYCGGDCVELRVMRADGSADRSLYRPAKPSYVYLFDWSPDGKYISALLEPLAPDSDFDLVVLDTRTGEARKLKTFPRSQRARQALFSPDGRYLAYELPEQPRHANRDIWLLSLDGSQTALVQNPGDDRMLAWLPNAVLFASDRSGAMDVWMQPMTSGKPQGPPERLRSGIGNLESALGLSRQGSLYYSVHAAINDVFVAPLDPATGKVIARGAPVTQRHAGRYGYAVWSPDGKRLASIATLSDKQRPGFTVGPFPVIVLREMATGEERDLQHSVPNLQEFNWAPDGQSLVASGFSGQRWGIYKVDSRTGDATLLINSDVDIVCPQLSPDGKALYYLERSPEERKILALDLASGQKRVVVKTALRERDYHLHGWFALSPDGERIAFQLDNETAHRLLTTPAGGGDPQVVYESKVELIQQWGLAWSPDGRYLLFVERPDGKSPFELWRLPAQGGRPEKLGLTAEGLHAPRVHPDGTRITYSSGDFNRVEIWVLENFLPAASLAATARR